MVHTSERVATLVWLIRAVGKILFKMLIFEVWHDTSVEYLAYKTYMSTYYWYRNKHPRKGKQEVTLWIPKLSMQEVAVERTLDEPMSSELRETLARISKGGVMDKIPTWYRLYTKRRLLEKIQILMVSIQSVSKWMDISQPGNELVITFSISIGCNYNHSERYHISWIVSFCTFV
jgi:hypothetical protein